MVKIDTTYALPIGKGQRFLNSNGLLSNLFGGWQVSAILNYSQGAPLGVAEDNVVLSVLNGDGDGINRPNSVPGVKTKTFNYKLSKEYFAGKASTQPVQFTTNAFTPSPYYGIGNAPRNDVNIHSQNNAKENLSAMKYFHATDRVTMTLRCDYFNAFNRTILSAPDNDIDDSTFGMVTSESASNRQGQANFQVRF
jgi:hypothetical protein